MTRGQVFTSHLDARGVHSPDREDALALPTATWARPGAREEPCPLGGSLLSEGGWGVPQGSQGLSGLRFRDRCTLFLSSHAVCFQGTFFSFISHFCPPRPSRAKLGGRRGDCISVSFGRLNIFFPCSTFFRFLGIVFHLSMVSGPWPTETQAICHGQGWGAEAEG